MNNVYAGCGNTRRFTNSALMLRSVGFVWPIRFSPIYLPDPNVKEPTASAHTITARPRSIVMTCPAIDEIAGVKRSRGGVVSSQRSVVSGPWSVGIGVSWVWSQPLAHQAARVVHIMAYVMRF